MDSRGHLWQKERPSVVKVVWSSDGAVSTAERPAQWSLRSELPDKAPCDRKPTGRREVLMLCEWLQAQLASVQGNEERQLEVWDDVAVELIAQVRVQCAERGRLLGLVRENYLRVIDGLQAELRHERGEDIRDDESDSTLEERRDAQRCLLGTLWGGSCGESHHSSPRASPCSTRSPFVKAHLGPHPQAVHQNGSPHRPPPQLTQGSPSPYSRCSAHPPGRLAARRRGVFERSVCAGRSGGGSPERRRSVHERRAEGGRAWAGARGETSQRGVELGTLGAPPSSGAATGDEERDESPRAAAARRFLHGSLRVAKEQKALATKAIDDLVSSSLSRSHLERVLGGVLDRWPPEQRASFLRSQVDGLPHDERLELALASVPVVAAEAEPPDLRRTCAAAFAPLEHAERCGLLSQLAGAVHTHQQAAALRACFDGVCEEARAPALASLLVEAPGETRRAALAVVRESAALGAEDRRVMRLALSGGVSDASCQTEAAALAPAASGKEAEGAEGAEGAVGAVGAAGGRWEQSTAARRQALRRSQEVRDLRRSALSCPYGIHFVGYFGALRRVPDPELLPLPQLLALLAAAIADKADAERLGGQPCSLASFLCARATKRGQRGSGDLSSLLHSANIHSAGHARVKAFCDAAGLLRPLEADADGLVERALAVCYGEPAQLRLRFASPDPLRVPLTREAADAARVAAGPIGSIASRVSWGSVEELCEVSELPAHLCRSLMERAEQRSSAEAPSALCVDGARAVDCDELLGMFSAARRTLRRQQQAMLRARFEAADADGNGVLTVAEFGRALRGILLSMAGRRDDASAAECFDRGRAEELFHEVLLEAGADAASGGETVTAEMFVAVMLRFRWYDTDYGGFLERKPDQAVSCGLSAV